MALAKRQGSLASFHFIPLRSQPCGSSRPHQTLLLTLSAPPSPLLPARPRNTVVDKHTLAFAFFPAYLIPSPRQLAESRASHHPIFNFSQDGSTRDRDTPEGITKGCGCKGDVERYYNPRIIQAGCLPNRGPFAGMFMPKYIPAIRFTSYPTMSLTGTWSSQQKPVWWYQNLNLTPTKT